MSDPTIEVRMEGVLDFARKVAKKTRSWIEIHNAVFGIGGAYGKTFPAESDRVQAGKTDAHKQVWQLIREARAASEDALPGDQDPAAREATGVTSVRMPVSLHAALLAEADAERCSLNQLIVIKLAIQLRSAVRPS